MTEQKKPTISIITATYNAAAVLPRLIESLMAQTDQDFEWVVADGGSTDGTLALLESARANFKNMVIDSRPDFGIYDALNRGVKLATAEYYVVLGGDDELLIDGIEKYKKGLFQTGFDFIAFGLYVGDRIAKARGSKLEFLYSTQAHVASHAVGLVIKKELHERFGYYSRAYPITADQLFILSAIKKGAKLYKSTDIVGKFSSDGVSHVDAAGALTESFRVNLRLGHNFYIQLLLLMLRLIKNKSKIVRFKIQELRF